MQMLLGFGGSEGAGTIGQNTAHQTVAGQCTKCHMPNADHSFNISYDTSCSPCHSATDAANRAATVSTNTLNALVALRSRMESWATTTFNNAADWDYTSNLTGTLPNEALVPIQVKRARFNYYFILQCGDYGIHNTPYTNYLLTYANSNLDSINVPPSTVKPMSKEAAKELLKADRLRSIQAEKVAAR